MDQSSLKALILGGSGAVGRDKKELISELCNSPKWSEISVIARRKLPEWDKLVGKEKIKFIEVSSLDELEDTNKWKSFNGYSSFFCCLGGRTKDGDAQFYKVDYTYCLYGGQIAIANQIPHYSLVSSGGADKCSMFLYMKTKGQIEESLTKLGFPLFSILRPGLIANRSNDDRFGETIAKYIPFISKIETKDLALAQRLEAEQAHQKQFDQPKTIIYTNDMLNNMVKVERTQKK